MVNLIESFTVIEDSFYVSAIRPIISAIRPIIKHVQQGKGVDNFCMAPYWFVSRSLSAAGLI